MKDRGLWAWLTVIGQFLSYFLIFGFFKVFTVFIDDFKAYYDITDIEVNCIPAFFSLGCTISGIIGGPIVELFGPRKSVLLFGPVPGNR